ncbi:MAG: hypothetical protein M1591_03805 [Deltaproteobacteria bacterium]|nr:hypothetical protein [Deltaproteobacteria bacterium]
MKRAPLAITFRSWRTAYKKRGTPLSFLVMTQANTIMKITAGKSIDAV